VTTKLGAFTFPIDPQVFKDQEARDLKKVHYYVDLPLILNMGPLSPRLRLKGALAETGKDASYAETNWLNPLNVMYDRPMSIPKVIADDDQFADTFWTVGTSGSGVTGTPTLSDDTSVVQKNNNSLKIVVPSGSKAYWYLSHTYSPVIDLSKADFFTYWWYGANTGKDLRFWFKEGSAYFYYTRTENWTGWQRVLIRKDQFSTSGSPDWTNIDKVEFWMLFAAAATHYLDRTMVGVGYYFNAPGDRYDGIYNLKKMIIDESHKALAVFPFDIELWWVDDYY